MCDRHMKLTFHHLVPKSTHSHYIKKRRVPGEANMDRGRGRPTNGSKRQAKIALPNLKNAQGTKRQAKNDRRSAKKQTLFTHVSVTPGNLTIPNFDAKFDIAGFLHAYGVYMCRPCHSAIHRCIPNKDLAEEYNSRERLMDVNKIRAWAEFNGGTKVKTKVKTGEK